MGNQHSNGNGNKKKTIYKVPPGAEKPYAPAKPTVEYIGDDVMVRWSEPVFNGGCPIMGYILQFNRVDGEIWESYRVDGTECLLKNLDDTFVFRVVAENIVGYSEPSETSLPVSFEFSEPTLLVPLNHEIRAIEFEKVELNCRIWGMPSPELIWYLNGEELFASNRIYMQTDGIDYKLVFNHIKISDEGEIRAVAKNLLGEIETTASIIVEAPPRIKSPKHYEEGLIARAGENLRLKFGFTGRPKADVTWYHDAEHIINKRTQTQELGDVAVLTVENVSSRDGGEYTIRVENCIGEDVAHVLVTVTDRPAAPSKPTVIQLSDNSCLLEWEELSDDVTAYIVEYFRDGWGVWLKAMSTRSNGCKIRDLIPGSKYRFRIKAENHFGTSDNGEESVQIYIPESKKEQGSVMSSIQEDEFEVFSEFNPESSFEKLEQVIPPIPETRKSKPQKPTHNISKSPTFENPLKSYLSKADNAYLPKTDHTSKSDSTLTSKTTENIISKSEYSPTTDYTSKIDVKSKPEPDYSSKTDFTSKQEDYISKMDVSPKIDYTSNYDFSLTTAEDTPKFDSITFSHFPSTQESLKNKPVISSNLKTDHQYKTKDEELHRKEPRVDKGNSDFSRRTASASPIDNKPLAREGNYYRRDQLIGNSGKMKSDDSLSSISSSQSDGKNRYFEQYSLQPRAGRGVDRFEKYRKDQKQETGGSGSKNLPADVTKDSNEDLDDSFKDTSFVIVEDVDDDYEDESMDFVVSQLIVPVKKGNVKISTSFDNGSVCASSVKSSMDDLSLDPSRNNTPDFYQHPPQNVSADNINAQGTRSLSASSSTNGSRTNLLQSFAEFSKSKYHNSENVEENPFFIKIRQSPTPSPSSFPPLSPPHDERSPSPSPSPSFPFFSRKLESERKSTTTTTTTSGRAAEEEEDQVHPTPNVNEDERRDAEQLVGDKDKKNNKSLRCRINDVVDVTVALLLLCMLGPLLFTNVYTLTLFCLLLIKMTFM